MSLALLLLASGAAYAWLSRSAEPTSAPTPATHTSATAASSQPAKAKEKSTLVPIQTGRDFDPQGNPNRENPRLVKLAYDGKRSTRWETMTYFHNPKLGGLKRGVGLVLDLGRTQPVSSVRLALSGNGTAVQLRVPKPDPARVDVAPLGSDSRWQTVSARPRVKRTATLALAQPTSTRFLLVYLTSLPREGAGYRGGIYEVEVRS